MSLFQGSEINLSNAKQNDEDEDDLEDQRRRNEELQNLLKAKLDDFNFDESTVNSSTNISILSTDELQNKYCDTTNPNEQLKMLYEVRLREISSLKEEYDNYKKDKTKEIDNLRNKMFTSEAENQHLKITLKNSEELLVEQTSCITEMKNVLSKLEKKIEEYEKTVHNLHIDIGTYQSTINELQLKLVEENNPFHLGKKQFNSEELRRAHQEQIDQLEALLQEKTKTTSTLEKENLSLQQQVKTCIDMRNEDSTAINVLTKNLEGVQKQCNELIGIIEKLSNENHHLRDRVKEKYVENTFQETASKNSSETIERLKKMLLDKSIENESLEAKLRDYENNLRELLEYRALKSDVYKKEFQQCDNKDHIKSLLLMQNDLQNYKRLIDDKNQQILSLDTTNKELLAKLEDMLSQTRNDIQNFSHKYNLPQLEKMTEDLRKSQEKIAELEVELKESEERRNSLCMKLQKANKSPHKDMDMRLKDLQQQNEKDRINFENQLKKLNKEVEVAAKENSNLKAYIDQLIDENTKLKHDIKNYHHENETETNKLNRSDNTEESLKKHYQKVIQELQESRNRIKNLEENIQELINAKTLAEGEQCNLRYQISDYKNKLNEQNETIKDLENEINNLNISLKEKNELINGLRQNQNHKDQDLKDKLLSSEHAFKKLEGTKHQLVQQLQKLEYELEQSEAEIIKLRKELAIETEKNVQRNVEKEIKDSEHALDQLKEIQNEEAKFNLIKIECKLREEIQKDYLQKLKEIETKYEKSSACNKQLFKEQAEKLKNQEYKFREQFSLVLAECAEKIKALEDNNQDLLKKYNNVKGNFENYKQHVAASEEAYKKVIRESQKEVQRHVAHSNNWLKKYYNDCIEIENMCKENKEKIVIKMNAFDKEVAAVEKTYNEKIKKYVKNCKI